MRRKNSQPSFTPDDETDLVRGLLRWFGRELQQRGEIPPDVSGIVIDIEMEQYVAPMIQALHKSPLYPLARAEGPQRLEWLICRVLEENLGS